MTDVPEEIMGRAAALALNETVRFMSAYGTVITDTGTTEAIARALMAERERAENEAFEKAAKLVDTWSIKRFPDDGWLGTRKVGREEARAEFSTAIRAMTRKA